MPIQDQIQVIPRTYVRTALQAARLPLHAAEAVVRRGKDKDSEWPPTLAFDAFGANVKQAVGSFLRDETLVQEGRLDQARVAELRRAASLAGLAAEVKDEADAERAERLDRDAQRRDAVEREAREREQALERQAADKKRAAEREAAGREAAIRRQQEAADKAIAKQERQAKATRIDKERVAVAQERQSLQADAKAAAIDKELKVTKAVRKSR